MPREIVPVPGSRPVDATLHYPSAQRPDSLQACVVACPPHPEHGGHRGDQRLTTVAEALFEHNIATLSFDYGPWDGGYGEREDCRNALRWATAHAGTVGAFGYSFGAAIATLAVATVDVSVGALSLLAPASHLAEDLDAADALEDISCPVQVAYGTRDETADWSALVTAAREQDRTVVELAADHHFVGQRTLVAETVVPFLVEHLT